MESIERPAENEKAIGRRVGSPRARAVSKIMSVDPTDAIKAGLAVPVWLT